MLKNGVELWERQRVRGMIKKTKLCEINIAYLLKSRKPQHCTKYCSQLSKAGSRRGRLPQEEHTNWLSNAKWLTLKKHTYK